MNKDKFCDYCKRKGHIVDDYYMQKNNEDNSHSKSDKPLKIAVIENNPEAEVLLITNSESRPKFK